MKRVQKDSNKEILCSRCQVCSLLNRKKPGCARKISFRWIAALKYQEKSEKGP